MPRRKIAKAEGLPKLTAKQMKFCECILAGMTQRVSYRTAFAPPTMSDAAVDCEASRLRNSPKIALWLDAVMTPVIEAARCTLEEHLTELARLKSIAIRTGNVGAAVQAEQLRGKASGHYVEQYVDLTPVDPIRELETLAATHPDLARALADQLNVPWQPNETRH